MLLLNIMFLVITPDYEYIICNGTEIPCKWLDKYNIEQILFVQLPHMNFDKITVNDRYISTIYNEEIVKETAFLRIEYCSFFCESCFEWTDRCGHCTKCFHQVCNECVTNHYNKDYCINCYDYIIDNDSVS